MMRVMQLHDFEDISINNYENAQIYKQRTKKYHDKNLMSEKFHLWQQILTCKSKLRLFPRKLQPERLGPKFEDQFQDALVKTVWSLG